MDLDLVIRGGTIVDGSGSAPYRADIGIRAGRIVEIGHTVGRGKREIGASELVVTPGFIDGHTHMDAQVMWDSLGTCSCWHGVTTVVMGNCGFSLAPTREDGRALILRTFEKAEDMSADALAKGVEWRWESFSEYLDVLSDMQLGINYACQIGHSALRTWAMGQRAFEESATPRDMELMVAELSSALLAGAVGFTSSRGESHETSDGLPIASRVATWSELHELVAAMRGHGRRVFEVTPRLTFESADERRDEYARLLGLAHETQSPLTFGLIGDASERDQTLSMVEDAAERGVDVMVQTHSKGVSSVMSLGSHLPFDHLPVWRSVRSLPIEGQLRAIREESTRRALIAAATDGAYVDRVGTETRRPQYDKMTVLLQATPPNPTVGEIAEARGMGPVELMLDLILETDGAQFFAQQLTPLSDAELLSYLRHPRGVMTFSDSGAHVSQIMDASIQTHLLAYWVRDRGDFTLEEAIRMITHVPARFWGFTSRGLLQEGMVADINVFDPETIGPLLPNVVHDLPAGAMRLDQRSTGFLATIIAGETLIEHGEHTGLFPGTLIRAGAE